MDAPTKNVITIEEIRQKAVPVLRSAGIIRSAVFGSVVRGEAKENSDIDFVIEIDPKVKFSLFDLAGLKHELEDILGRKVDLVTRRSIYPPLKKYIEKEEIAIL